MTHRNSLKFRILIVLFGGALLSLTIILGFWLKSERHLILQSQNQAVRNQMFYVVSHLTNDLNRSLDTARVIANSVALRRHVIRHSQEIMSHERDERKQYIEKMVGERTDLDRNSAINQQILNSLEADFLRATVNASGEIIDQIMVTDAFGFVRVSTHVPDEAYVFFSDWWQRALKMGKNQIYYDQDTNHPTGDYAFFAMPLYDDQGVNAVGIIRFRLSLILFFERMLEKTPFTTNVPIFVTDRNQIFPAVTNSTPFSIGELISYAKQGPSLFEDNTDKYILGTGNTMGRVTSVIPEIQWTVVTYQKKQNVISFKYPAFREAITLWLIGLLFLSLLSYIVAIWFTEPLGAWILALREISDGNYNVRAPGSDQKEFTELSDLINKMAQTMEDSSLKTSKTIRETNAALSAFEDFTQEAALEHDRRIIADSLLRLSIRRLSADAGVLIIQNPDYKTPMTLKYNVSEQQIEKYSTLAVHGVNSKNVFFAWDHPEHQDIWDDGFQVMLATPVRTRHSRYGTLYLLFYQAISTDIKKDRAIELLALQAAVYSSRTGLYHQLDRQISFNEGILSGIPWFICTLDSQMNITWHNSRTDYLKLNHTKKLVNSKCCTVFRNRDSVCPDCPARQTINDGKQHEITQRWISDTGETRWMKVSSFPFMDATGNMRSVILFLRDISSETQAQSEVLQLSRAIDNIGEAVVITDNDGKIVFVNKALSRILNYSEKEILSSSLSVIFSHTDEKLYQTIQSEIRDDKMWTNEVNLIDRNEKEVTVSITAALVRDIDGLPIGQVFTCYDVSRRILREKQMIKQFRELEVLHKISSILMERKELNELLGTVLNAVSEFSGCKSGCILLFDRIRGDIDYNQDIQVSLEKPTIIAETLIPGFFHKYIEELRQGRESDLFRKISTSDKPLAFNNIQSTTSLDAKLINRMGFRSMLTIPVISGNTHLGLIFLFSKSAFHFSTETLEIYQSICSQIGLSVNGRYLQEKLATEARYLLTGEIASRIGGDVKQVLQGLEFSRHNVETAMGKRSWEDLDQGWLSMSRQIWHLYHVTLNILSYGSQNLRLFFPEDLNQLIRTCINQFTSRPFSKRLQILFKSNEEFSEVYINKLAIQRALINLLLLSVESCWFADEPQVIISIKHISGSGDRYALDISHNGEGDTFLNECVNEYRESSEISHLPVLLAAVVRCAEAHNGEFSMTENSQRDVTFRMTLPRYPEK